MEIKKKYIIGISVCVLLIVSVFFIFNQGKVKWSRKEKVEHTGLEPATF